MKDHGQEKVLPFNPSEFPVTKQKVFMDDGRIYMKETTYHTTKHKLNSYSTRWVEIPSQTTPKPTGNKNMRMYIGKYASYYWQECGCYVRLNQTCPHGSTDS